MMTLTQLKEQAGFLGMVADVLSDIPGISISLIERDSRIVITLQFGKHRLIMSQCNARFSYSLHILKQKQWYEDINTVKEPLEKDNLRALIVSIFPHRYAVQE